MVREIALNRKRRNRRRVDQVPDCEPDNMPRLFTRGSYGSEMRSKACVGQNGRWSNTFTKGPCLFQDPQQNLQKRIFRRTSRVRGSEGGQSDADLSLPFPYDTGHAQNDQRKRQKLLFFCCSLLLRCDLLAKKVPGRAPYSQHIMIRNWT